MKNLEDKGDPRFMENLDLRFEANNVFFRCVEDSTEAIMISDLNGILVYVNPAWSRIYEYSFDEAIGQTPRILRSRFQSSDFYKKMWAEILDPQRSFWRGDLINQSKSGREVSVSLTITPIKRFNTTVGYMGIAIDRTEKMSLEAKIFQQDRLASIGLLASSLAHEIGTPLGVIRGRAELIKSMVKTEVQIIPGLDIIIQQIDRISKLINNLLNLSRDQKSGGRCIAKAAINESVTLLAQKFRENGIDVNIDVPDNVTIAVDHNKFEQVVINLLVNSVHAIRAAISEGRKSNHRVVIQYKEDFEKQLFYFSDTGSGIPDNVKQNLFRPFFTTKDVGEGTGLGLSISYQILESYRGSLALDKSIVGEGTTFVISLPKYTSGP